MLHSTLLHTHLAILTTYNVYVIHISELGFLLRICFHNWNQAIGKVSGFCSIQTFKWLDRAHPAISATGFWWRIKSQKYGHVRTSWNPDSLLWMFIGSDNLCFFPSGPHYGPSCWVGDILSMSTTPQAQTLTSRWDETGPDLFDLNI